MSIKDGFPKPGRDIMGMPQIGGNIDKVAVEFKKMLNLVQRLTESVYAAPCASNRTELDKARERVIGAYREVTKQRDTFSEEEEKLNAEIGHLHSRINELESQQAAASGAPTLMEAAKEIFGEMRGFTKEESEIVSTNIRNHFKPIEHADTARLKAADLVLDLFREWDNGTHYKYCPICSQNTRDGALHHEWCAYNALRFYDAAMAPASRSEE